MKTFLKSFLKDEAGASAAEYALILAVVGSAIVVGALTLGDSIGSSLKDTASCIDAPGTEAAPNAKC